MSTGAWGLFFVVLFGFSMICLLDALGYSESLKDVDYH